MGSFYEQAWTESINQSINLSICLQHLNQCSYSALHRFDSTWDHSMSRHGQNQSINLSICLQHLNQCSYSALHRFDSTWDHSMSRHGQNQSINLSICLPQSMFLFSTWDHSMSRHGQNQSINQSIDMCTTPQSMWLQHLSKFSHWSFKTHEKTE